VLTSPGIEQQANDYGKVHRKSAVS
jgi:hypothetical protein